TRGACSGATSAACPHASARTEPGRACGRHSRTSARTSLPRVLKAPVLEAIQVHKAYTLGQTRVAALRGVDLALASGDFVAVAGPSGSGKTTLLNLLGTLDEPDAGSIVFAGVPLASLRESERARLRRRKIGFVFQSFNLVPVLSARENVEYPLWIDGIPARDRARRVAEALESVGLTPRSDHRPDHL